MMEEQEKYINRNNRVRGNVERELQKNVEMLEELFKDCGDIVKLEFVLGQLLPAYIVYVDGLADHTMVEDFVLRPLKNETFLEKDQLLSDFSEEQKKQRVQEMMELADITWKETMNDSVVEILSGNTLLFVDGIAAGIMISSKKLPTRGVGEVDSEKTMRGSKDAFNESMRTGTALLRRRIRDSRFKVKQVFVGQRSNTNVAICYVKGLVREEWLEEIESRIKRLELDAIYDSGMIEHLIEPNFHSPFPQYQHTERPDKAASALLEGRIVLVVDNSPDVLILPATLNTFFQASDDYYNQSEVATFARILRYIGAFLAVGLPGLYLAVISYHTEILPAQLVFTIAKARETVPFPAVVEVLLMELEFELLREAGIRLPGQMGNTIGVVGGLIIGQAAVDAGLVSTIVVIVVALTAIASFSIPNESFTSAFRLLKFFFIIVCSFWGIYGFFLGLLIVGIHLASLESLGVPYLMPAVSGADENYDDAKDFLIKKPIYAMIRRPFFTKEGQRIRMRNEDRENRK